MPRQPRSVTWKTSVSSARAAGLPSAGTTRCVRVLQDVLAALQLPHREPDALQDVQRLETGHHDRDLEPLGQRRILLGAHHAADVAGGQEALHPAGRARS